MRLTFVSPFRREHPSWPASDAFLRRDGLRTFLLHVLALAAVLCIARVLYATWWPSVSTGDPLFIYCVVIPPVLLCLWFAFGMETFVATLALGAESVPALEALIDAHEEVKHFVSRVASERRLRQGDLNAARHLAGRLKLRDERAQKLQALERIRECSHSQVGIRL
jgi:hypothetical protein